MFGTLTNTISSLSMASTYMAALTGMCNTNINFMQ